MVWQVEVVTDIHCYGVGAACSDFGDFMVTAVLYNPAIFPMCSLYLAAFAGSFFLQGLFSCMVK